MSKALGKIHAADLRKSERLQDVYRFLSDGKEHTTREIQNGTICCNAHTAKAELEANGCRIDCNQRGKYFYYRMVSGVDFMDQMRAA